MVDSAGCVGALSQAARRAARPTKHRGWLVMAAPGEGWTKAGLRNASGRLRENRGPPSQLQSRGHTCRLREAARGKRGPVAFGPRLWPGVPLARGGEGGET